MKWNKYSLPFIQTLFNYEEDIIYINNKGNAKRKTFKLLDQYIFYKNKNVNIYKYTRINIFGLIMRML